MNDRWFVYMVRCKNGSLYTGITNHLENRIETHNSGKGAKSVIMMGLPVKLVYSEVLSSKGDALRREIVIKKMSKAKKEKMVKDAGNRLHD